MIFIGYEHGSKAYRCLDPTSRKLCMSKDVIFEESKSLSFLVDNPSISISYEDFNTDAFQPAEEEVEESSEIPQDDPIQDGRNDINDEPLRYRSIQDVYEETNLTYDNLSLLITEEPYSYAEAVKEEAWRSAMAAKISAIE